MDANEAVVRRTALIVLGVIMVVAVGGLVIVAVATDRTIDAAVRGLLIGVGVIALTGGAVLIWSPRMRRGGDDE